MKISLYVLAKFAIASDPQNVPSWGFTSPITIQNEICQNWDHYWAQATPMEVGQKNYGLEIKSFKPVNK